MDILCYTGTEKIRIQVTERRDSVHLDSDLDQIHCGQALAVVGVEIMCSIGCKEIFGTMLNICQKVD
jgi:hypothetical protein